MIYKTVKIIRAIYLLKKGTHINDFLRNHIVKVNFFDDACDYPDLYNEIVLEGTYKDLFKFYQTFYKDLLDYNLSNSMTDYNNKEYFNESYIHIDDKK